MSSIIEFMGTPGAGKSALARSLLTASKRSDSVAWLSTNEALVRCLRRRNDGCLRNILKKLPPLAWDALFGRRHTLAELTCFAGANPAMFAFIFEVLNRQSMPLAWRTCILHAFFNRCTERLLIDEFLISDEKVFIEEGFAMGAFTLLNSLAAAPVAADVHKYCQHIPVPQAVIWVDVEPAQCVARLKKRPELPLLLAGCTESALLERLSDGRRCLEMTAHEIGARNIPVAHVSNPDGHLDAAWPSVWQWIQSGLVPGNVSL